MDFLLISLGDFGAVLGVNWFRTPGPINWDFDGMRMSFHKHGSNINLFGLQEVPVLAKNSQYHLLQLNCRSFFQNLALFFRNLLARGLVIVSS